MLQFDGAAGLLIPGGPQTANMNNFAVSEGLFGYYGFDGDCLDFVNNTAINLSPQLLGNPDIRLYNVSGVGTNTAGFTVISRTALPNGVTICQIGIYRTAAQTFNVKIAQANGSASYTIVVSQAFSHGGTGWENCTLSTPYTIPGSGTYSLGVWSATTMGECSNVVRAYIFADATGTVTMTEDTGTVQGLQYTVSVTTTNGSLNGGFTRASMVNGRIGQALQFNGSSNYVDITQLGALNSNTQSISMWLPNKGTNKTAYLIDRAPNADQYGYLALVYVGGNLILSVAGPLATLCTWASITNGDHLCLTLNYPNWVFYINGRVINSGTSGTAFNNNSSTKFTSIGRAGAFNNYYFDGIMDDVRIYNRALDQGEVIELHKAGLAGRRNAINYFSNFMPMLMVPSAVSQWQLYFSKNSGAYEPVTTTSTGVKSADASSDADETKILIPRL